MFEYCRKIGMEWGGMDSLPDMPGVAVRFSGHVGIYIGGGEVAEWRGFDYGCVITKLAGRKWTHWYMLPWVEYVGYDAAEDKPTETVRTLGSRLLVFGKKGEDVVLLQQALMQLGYPLTDWGADGDYGEETEKAVKDFQQDHGLDVDGDYGPMTHAELMAELAEREAQTDGEEDAAPVTPARHVRVTGSRVYVRKGPGKEHDVITVVRAGTLLEYVATADNGWHAIKADGIAGWISGKYTRVEE
jgi:hypothetical protein